MQTLNEALDQSYLYRRVEDLSIFTHSSSYFFWLPSSLRISRRYMTNV